MEGIEAPSRQRPSGRRPRPLARRLRLHLNHPRRWHGLLLVLIGIAIWWATAPVAHAQPSPQWPEPDKPVVHAPLPPAAAP